MDKKMKRMLFIDHAFHAHTKSAEFIKDLFIKEYTIDLIYLDPENMYDPKAFEFVAKMYYDTVVIWQLMPSLNWLKNYVSWNKISFFPMYDGIPSLTDPIWKEYRNTKIISFSRTLQKALRNRGFDANYIQYFPKPKKVKDWGKTDSVFYWQRVHTLPVQKVVDAIQNSISKIHIHTSLDPHHSMIDIITDKRITHSTWFENKEEMYSKILESAIYIAPRLSEGIGMSFLEAMSMGRCVIAPNQPTMNEYIQSGKTGFLYDLKDISKLKIGNINKIQKNTLKYVQRGYKSWNKKKKKILKWIKSPVHPHTTDSISQFFLFGKIPLFYWRKIK